MTKRNPTFRQQVAASTRRLEAQGKAVKSALMSPTTHRQRKPGTVLHRVKARRDDGSLLDKETARELFAHQPWAKHARYLGTSNGWIAFERPEEER